MGRSEPEVRALAATLIEARRVEMVSRYRARLGEIGSALASDDAYLDQAAVQADHVIGDVIAGIATGDIDVYEGAPDLIWQVGGIATSNNVHPGDSVQAATELFDIVVGVLSEVLSDQDKTALFATAVQSAHRSILTRIRWASGAYVSVLLERVHEALLAERRRISRDLHDRVGGVASVLLRNLELADRYERTDPSRARVKLDQARHEAVQTLEAIRQVAAELRAEAGVDNLEKALRAFIEAMADPGSVIRLTISGDEGWLPASTLDEVFYIAREGLRNAFTYAAAATTLATVDIAPHEVRVVVSDDGAGFDVLSSQSGGGIASMKERVRMLGGRLWLGSAPGRGTRLEVVIPLPGGDS